MAFDTLKLPNRSQQIKTTLIEDVKGKLLTEEEVIHKRWTEYCTELYNYKLKTGANILKDEEYLEKNRGQEESSLFEEVEKQYEC